MSDQRKLIIPHLFLNMLPPRLIYLLCFAGLTLSCTLVGLYGGHVFGRLGEWGINRLPWQCHLRSQSLPVLFHKGGRNVRRCWGTQVLRKGSLTVCFFFCGEISRSCSPPEGLWQPGKTHCAEKYFSSVVLTEKSTVAHFHCNISWRPQMNQNWLLSCSVTWSTNPPPPLLWAF